LFPRESKRSANKKREFDVFIRAPFGFARKPSSDFRLDSLEAAQAGDESRFRTENSNSGHCQKIKLSHDLLT
jgi:hypothetical protein